MITSAGAKKALRKRQQYQPKAIDLDPNFPKQNEFVEDKSRFIDGQCSRRAGKTNGLALRFYKTMERHPKSQCLYLALTFDSAKEIMMPAMREMNEKYKLGCTFTEGMVKHPNGSTLKLMGADMKNFIKRLKGRKHPGIGIDEAQDFGTHLRSLIDDVLTPCIADYEDGWLAVTGTPGPVPQGYFFEVTQQRKYGYSHHEWTILDNPHMPNPTGFIEDLKTKREWEDNNPTLLREWRNKWVLDVQSLWVRYKENLNHFEALPKLPSGKMYTYILGVDIGYKDADALAVLAWSEASPCVYLVKEVITPKQGITELVEQIQDTMRAYSVAKIVMDEGGLGKKVAEEIRRRYGIPVHAADKARKQENVELLNDYLRRARFMAHKDSRFAQDSYLVQIDWDKSTPDKIVIKKKPHSDIIDAVLYAFKESPAYSFREPEPQPMRGTPEWDRKQDLAMFEAEMEGHLEEQARERYLNGESE